MLRNMLPDGSTNNALNRGGANSVVRSYLVGRYISRIISGSDDRNVGFNELRQWVIATPNRISSDSPFVLHVLHVVRASAWKKVGGVYTDWIVAMVAHVKAVRNGAVSQLPSNVGGTSFGLVDDELAVARSTNSAKPWPATIIASRSVNLRPESIGNTAERPARSTTSATESAPGGVIRNDLKRASAKLADDGLFVTIGTHYWSLLNRFRGAVPQGIAVPLGLSRASIIPHFMGNMEVQL